MDDWSRQFLINSGVLDTETLSREAGSGFTEIAYYNFSSNKVTEFLPRPQTVEITNNISQDQTNLRTKKNFSYKATNHSNWRQAMIEMLVREYKLQANKLVTDQNIIDALATTNTFLYKQLKKNSHPHLLGDFPTPSEVAIRAAGFKAAGIEYELGGSNISMEEIMGMNGPLRTAITTGADPTKGTTVWIANAVFEAKQFGATLGAMNETTPGYSDQWKNVMETRSQFPEPFYVTGKEVTRARTTAQLTGDYTVLWKAYKESVPKAGEVAVRDIQDLTRALLSYGKKFGLIDVEAKQLSGVGIDYQERLLRAAFLTSPEAREAGLLSSEAHRAAEDAAQSESFVLRKKIESLRAFDLVEAGGEEGRAAIEQARKAQGPLSSVMKYFEMYNDSLPTLKRRHLLQQFERGIGDIEEKGYATHTNGVNEIIGMNQATPSGVPTQTYRVEHNLSFQNSEREYFEEVRKRGEFVNYGLQPEEEWNRMQKFIDDETAFRKTNPDMKQLTRKQLAAIHVENETEDALSSYFSQNAKRMLNMSGMKMAGRMKSRWAPMGLGNFVGHGVTKAGAQLNSLGTSILKNTPRAGMVMGGIALAGLVSHTAMQSRNVEELDNSKSILTMDYQEYANLRDQQQQEGFAESGFAKTTRAMNTDFGSPYQGPSTSFDVLVNQELLKEREKLNRLKFGAEHGNESGLFFPFSNPFRRNSTLTGRNPYTGELAGLRGTENMQVIDVKDGWDLEVEDVDTVMLKKKGFFGGVQRFFGLGGSHTFRLEGIDSTEISHGMFDKSWHTPQPSAVQSIEGMKKLMSAGDIKIAYDPKDNTYGRAVGTIFAGGSNVNLKAVERGLAAHLPYGSYLDAHADWDAYRGAEDKAHAAKRGVWGTAWGQVYKEFANSAGTQITFNTFARPSKMAENYETMKLISVMEHAQNNGGASLLELETAKHIGKKWNKFGDTIKPYRMEGNTAANYRTYIGNLMQDNTSFIQTRGTGSNPNKNESSNFNELNNYLAVDSLGTTNSVYSKRSLEAYKIYGADKALKRERKERMANMQRHINSKFGESSINHHRM